MFRKSINALMPMNNRLLMFFSMRTLFSLSSSGKDVRINATRRFIAWIRTRTVLICHDAASDIMAVVTRLIVQSIECKAGKQASQRCPGYPVPFAMPGTCGSGHLNPIVLRRSYGFDLARQYGQLASCSRRMRACQEVSLSRSPSCCLRTPV